ncbi:tRNA pseudouridine(55) synthase TruB [Clostridium oceanicum]|uniref:tRNA pseudouridine synthase B n=1 Tax=Clostridium oceanicum TaxID=1543 RepID=A0ABP3ULF4_9CLOT
MNGVINILKPSGISSFDVVRKVRKIVKQKKVGHTGTLDPLASGVLPICVGKGTKISDYLMKDKKIYRVEMKLGTVTDTYDREGKVIDENDVNLSKEEVIEAIKNYIGEIDQVPPMYSAIKVNGKKLYELARKGIEIERKSRKINIYSINILSVDLPYIVFDVKCSKGTYIRSLCYDIGRDLKCGAVMWNLQRLETGEFNIKDAIELQKLDENNVEDYLIPIDVALSLYDKIFIDERFEKHLLNGVTLKDRSIIENIEEDKLFRTYLTNDKFVGLGMKDKRGFKIYKMLI